MIVNPVLILSCALVVVSLILVYVLLSSQRNTDALKDHVSQLADSHLELSRKIKKYQEPKRQETNVGLIPVEAGVEGPIKMRPYNDGANDLKFYTSVEKPPSPFYQRVGIVYSESTTDDSVYNLEQRSIPPFLEDSFEYRVYDANNSVYINIHAQTGRELKNGCKIDIPGKNVGKFVVARDRDYAFVPMP